MSKSNKSGDHEPRTLASILAALERRRGKLSGVRLRDLRSAVKRVAELLGDEPAAIALDLPAVSSRLNTVSPLALGFTTNDSQTSDLISWQQQNSAASRRSLVRAA